MHFLALLRLRLLPSCAKCIETLLLPCCLSTLEDDVFCAKITMTVAAAKAVAKLSRNTRSKIGHMISSWQQ